MHDVFFFTDVHGRYDLFQAMRNWCYEQDKECTIVYGGDAADRGADGYRIIKELLDDPQIVYIYGNHEDLFIKAADAIIGTYANNDEQYQFLHNCNHNRAMAVLQEMTTVHYNEDVALHIYNGGESTLLAWLEDGANEEIIDRLRILPRTFSYENIDFCHAGGTYKSFKAVAEAEYNNKLHPWFDEQTIIWDRNCIPLGWETDRICVHGHTPTMTLPAKIYGRDKSPTNTHPCAWHDLLGGTHKRGGLKIDMDTGMVFTGHGFVLNCTTMKATEFENPNISVPNLPSYVTITKEYQLI